MPYIVRDRRAQIVRPQPSVPVQAPRTVGELTWLLSEIIQDYRTDQGEAYQTFANIIAALEQTKDEFRRQVVHPYEDQKLIQNGPVFR